MKIAILGGGITGLVAAYYLQDDHEVDLYEKEQFLGGLAGGFRKNRWQWPLERTYHHLFDNDYHLNSFCREVGFNNIFYNTPQTSSLFKINNKYSEYFFDEAVDIFKIPYLSAIDRIRLGVVVLWLKLSPFMREYEKLSSQEFLIKTMGRNTWETIWEQLFQKKFGKYANEIRASFIWARIHKRSKKLGYFTGGFQSFVDELEKIALSKKTNIFKNKPVKSIKTLNNKYIINNMSYDVVISTVPIPVFCGIAGQVLPNNYLTKLNKIQYLHALTMVLETKKPILKKTYWLNVLVKNSPLMLVGQHTNFINKKYYDNNHIAYVGFYLEKESKLFQLEKKSLYSFVCKALRELDIEVEDNKNIVSWDVFKSYWAQPIFNKTFIENKPEFSTPLKNLYLATLDMTYPYDRGINYAIKIARQVAQLV